MFCAFLVLWAISCIALPYPKFFALQHVPTVIGTLALVAVERRYGVSNFCFLLITVFLLLHVLGARYLYSYVPYDDWAECLFGMRISDRFGFERNHYDRLVHFAFGLLFVYPIWQLAQAQLKLNNLQAAALAITVILAASAVYEIAEWAVAMILAPDWAESYNGQQGDPWDAQRDMSLAWLGSIAGVVAAFVRKGPKG